MMRTLLRVAATTLLGGALLTGCVLDRGPSDAELEARVETALARASDLDGADVEISVSEGVVTVGGSLTCADCAATRTPAGMGSIEQSVGAIVRAVPGVKGVEFSPTPDQ